MKYPYERFSVKHVPVPQGGFIVRDHWAVAIPLIVDGKRWKGSRHQPHSHYYETREEAHAIVDWLNDRAAGYPYNLLLADAP